jgi:hypothetical protein
MGKKDKEHRAKVAKRNVKSNQDKYAMQNALNKIMKRMAEEKEVENLSVSVGDKEVPFQVESIPVGNSIVNFKEALTLTQQKKKTKKEWIYSIHQNYTITIL